MIVWVDVETTGLDARSGHLLEVALVVTDDDLSEVAARDVVVRPVGADVDRVYMEPVVREMHQKNGLLADVRERGLRRHEAEEVLVTFVRALAQVPPVPSGKCARCGRREEEHLPDGDGPRHAIPTRCPSVGAGAATTGFFEPEMLPVLPQTPLAGSSVAFDRQWLAEHMPRLHGLFHYRSIDVSSITELARRWAPGIYAERPKAADAHHRALADIRESIEYLRYYRRSGFVAAEAAA